MRSLDCLQGTVMPELGSSAHFCKITGSSINTGFPPAVFFFLKRRLQRGLCIAEDGLFSDRFNDAEPQKRHRLIEPQSPLIKMKDLSFSYTGRNEEGDSSDGFDWNFLSWFH